MEKEKKTTKVWITCKVLVPVVSETVEELMEELKAPLADMKQRYHDAKFLEFEPHVDDASAE